MKNNHLEAEAAVQFTVEQATLWAKFSGDYNPIHFDQQSAMSLGQNNKVVHGMLPLIYLKTALSQKVLASNLYKEQLNRALFVNIKCFFKTPLYYNVPITTLYTESDNAEPIKFGLYSGQPLTLNFRGVYSLLYTFPRLAIYQKNIDVIPMDLHRCYQTYRQCIKSSHYLWVFLEAFAFSQFIKRGIYLLFDKDGQSFTEGEEFKGLPGCSVVQVHQITWIGRTLFDLSMDALPDFLSCNNELSLKFYRYDITQDEHQRTSEVEVGFFSGSKPLLLLHIGLLVKFHTQMSQHY